jgi:hypothetical protein
LCTATLDDRLRYEVGFRFIAIISETLEEFSFGALHDPITRAQSFRGIKSHIEGAVEAKAKSTISLIEVVRADTEVVADCIDLTDPESFQTTVNISK